jgi:hypothetical protein
MLSSPPPLRTDGRGVWFSKERQNIELTNDRSYGNKTKTTVLEALSNAQLNFIACDIIPPSHSQQIHRREFIFDV